MLKDSFGRVIRDLRISVTDRCNFRCFYCKPQGEFQEQYRSGLATYEELLRITQIFAEMGIKKVRLTGGEPLLRREIEQLIQGIAAIDGIEDIAMTTNGFLLPQKAQQLKDAGLHRLTISLDTFRADRFHKITGSDALNRVKDGIKAAEDAGFPPLKLNTVIVRGLNDDELLEFAKFSRETGHIVRFIEFMPLDSEHRWTRESMVSKAEMLEQLAALGPLVPLPPKNDSETANKYRYADGKGEIGIIASVTSAFCDHCSRVRLTADGQLRTCLFAHNEHSLLDHLRAGASDDELRTRIRDAVWQKQAGHRINEDDYQYPSHSMSLIGG